MFKYNAKDVVIIVDGKIIDDFAEGTMVSAEETNSHTTPVVDSQGKGAMAINNDRRGTFTLNLKFSSDANKKFTTLLNSAKEFSISFAHGDEKASATQAMFQKAPAVGYDNGVPTRTWIADALDFNYIR